MAGALLTCLNTLDSDAAVKQILLALNDQRSFIVEDLDDYHIVIKVDEEYWVRSQLEIEVRGSTRSTQLTRQLTNRLSIIQLEKNTYSLDQN